MLIINWDVLSIEMQSYVITVIAEPDVSDQPNFQDFVVADERSDHKGSKLGSSF